MKSSVLVISVLLLWGCNISDPMVGPIEESEAAPDVGVADTQEAEGDASLDADGAGTSDTGFVDVAPGAGEVGIGDVGDEDAEVEPPEPCEAGACWEVARARLTEFALLQGDVLVATGPHGLFGISEDSGQSWHFHGPEDPENFSPSPVRHLEVNAEGHLFGVRDQRIVRSIDGGMTFEEVPTPTGVVVFDIAIQPETTRMVAAGGFDCNDGSCTSHMLLETNDLETWTPIIGLEEGVALERVWIGSLGQIVTGAASDGWYFRARPGAVGDAWIGLRELNDDCDTVHKVLWNEEGGAISLGSSVMQRSYCLHVDAAGAGEFERASVGTALRRANVVDGTWLDDERFVAMTSGGLMLSTQDAGQSWTSASTNIPELRFVAFAPERVHGFAIHGGAWRHQEGVNWNLEHLGLRSLPSALAFDAPEPIMGLDVAGNLVKPDEAGVWEIFDDARRYAKVWQSRGRAFASVLGANHQFVTGRAWDSLSEIDFRTLPVTGAMFPTENLCGTGMSCTITFVHEVLSAADTGQTSLAFMHATVRQLNTSLGTARSYVRVFALRSVDGSQWEIVRAIDSSAEQITLTPSTTVISNYYSDNEGRNWEETDPSCAIAPMVYVEELDELLAFGAGSLCVSSDRGLTWESRGDLADILGEQGNLSSVDAAEGYLALFWNLAAGDSLVFISDDFGASWARRDLVMPPHMKVYPEPEGLMHLVGPNGLYLLEQR